jgi:hypothetical protein
MRMVQEKTVYPLTFMHRLFPVNCYFIEEEDNLTLIGRRVGGCRIRDCSFSRPFG